MSELNASGGGISFTAKELIARVDAKADKILERLDAKADRSEVSAVSSRLTDIELHGSSHAAAISKDTHELDTRVTTLEKENERRQYLVNEFLSDHKRLESMDRELARLSNGLTTAIKNQLDEANKTAIQTRDRTLSNKEKKFVIASVLVAALGTLVSLFVLILSIFNHVNHL